MIKPLPNPIQEKDATVNFMWSYFKAYQKEIRELGIKLEHHKIQAGYDRYYDESGEYFDIFILDLHLQIGYVFVTEDHTSNHQSPLEWFKSQEHLSLSRICQEGPLALYHEFLQELYQLYLKTNSEYYWFTKSGKLISDEGANVISSNNVRLNKSLLRDIKLEEILK